MTAKPQLKNGYDRFLQQIVRTDSRSKISKRRTGIRDRGRCFCCDFHIGVRVNIRHHIKPVAKGGERWRQNIVTLCPNCHALVHELSRSWWCSAYQLRDSVACYPGMEFGRAFKLALIATEEVVIEDDRTIWPRTIHRPRETLNHVELHDLLFVDGYLDPNEIEEWENA